MATSTKRKPNHGKDSFETLGRIALNGIGDWVEARFVGSQEVQSRDGKEQTVHAFIGTVVTEEKGERFGEFELWGNMNLNKILTQDKWGITLIVECVRREKNKDGTREFSIYKYSESLNQIKLAHEKTDKSADKK